MKFLSGTIVDFLWEYSPVTSEPRPGSQQARAAQKRYIPLLSPESHVN